MKKSSDSLSLVHQPHDKVIKKILSNPLTAHDVLSLYLPAEVLAIADLNKLELQRDSFIDDEHRAYAVDLLYKTTLHHEEGYIWILLEHQRKSDPWMPVRLFKYIAIIWDHLRKTSKNKTIPLIYPLVLYNGTEPYAHSLNLSELIQPEASKKIFNGLFMHPFCLIDLASITDESLRKAASGKIKGIALLMALKHRSDKQIKTFFEQTLLNILKRLDRRGDIDEVVDILYYLLRACEFLDETWFWSCFHHHFSSEVEKKMTTIAQQIEERGIEKGKILTAEKLLTERTDLNEADLIAWVQRMTGLSIEKIKELRKKH